jgi:hypothetical protein
MITEKRIIKSKTSIDQRIILSSIENIKAEKTRIGVTKNLAAIFLYIALGERFSEDSVI